MQPRHMLRSVGRCLAASTIAAGLSTAASAQLTLSLEPPLPGPGDPVDIVLKGGMEDDYTLVLVALDPGPINFPFIGTLNVGLTDLTLYPLGQFDASGCLRFPCALNCFAAQVDPFFLQGITIRLTPNGPIVPAISNPVVLSIDDNQITDCNNNGIDDDCDIEEGRSNDCNDNDIPDECEPDCDGDGIPDECDTEVDSFCVQNLADDGCTGTTDRIVWIREISPREFALVDGGNFVENGDGTATFSGTIQNVGDALKGFDIDVVLSGRIEPGDANHPPAGSPKGSAGNCDVDEANYVYYTDISGTFMGRDDYEGAVYSLSLRGAAAQVGMGANQKNERYGLSSWYYLTQISPPDSGSLPATMDGDFNLDLVSGCDCEPCDDAPAWPTESGIWNLEGDMVVFAFGPDHNYTIDCMTASYDGDDLVVSGQASGPDGTIVIDYTITVFETGSDLQSNNGANDYGSITHIESGQTISLVGKKSSDGYAGRLESEGAECATLSAWFADSSGDLIGDFDTPAKAVCEDPCK